MQKESDHSPLREKPADRPINRRIAVAGAATQYKTTKFGLSNEEKNRKKVTMESVKQYAKNKGRNTS